ncbi:MAG: M23 family metallopeptidase, partial [Pyrinomonadaceae bacterium]|nr:M23 family metallopeptidase [Pyrinomonadaceae bacterium]
ENEKREESKVETDKKEAPKVEKTANSNDSANTATVTTEKTQTPTPRQNTSSGAIVFSKLMIPVVGVKPENLRDTFNDSRSDNRVHDAIDIMAEKNAVVIAAADGEIARFFDSERGGITIYQYSADKKLIYYYAHLDRRAENIKEGDFIKQGTTIGYVGDTGNSGAGNYHLHFAIWTIDDPKRFYDGTNINPYPLLSK